MATALVVLLLGGSAGAEVPADVLTRYGLQPVAESAPATDFHLPDLAGGRASLSDYHGRWVLLTFLATWCGPCRLELPSMERLHRERGNELAIVGVSIDFEQEPVAPFVEELGLTFDVLWDERSEVGRMYRASSIPLSYLIDPAGRVVALARGARDWSRMGGMVDELVSIAPPDPSAIGEYSDSAALDLGAVTAPPTATVILDEPSPVAGEVFHLDVRLSWAGNLNEYVPQPPRVRLPEGVERVGVTASTSSEEGRDVVTYRVALRANAARDYALGPVELRYTTGEGSSPLAGLVEGPTVSVREATMLGRSPATLALGAAVAVAVAAAVLFALGRRRRRRLEPIEPAGPTWEVLRRRFDEARSKRLAGNPAGFIVGMSGLLAELREDDDAVDNEIDDLMEQARYGGQVLPAEALDRMQRDVERRLDGLRPDPEKKERETVRLAEEGE